MKYDKQLFILFCSVSLTLHRGQLTVLMGKHGSGKSTLLRILAGLDSHTTGSCFVPYLRGVVRDGSPVRAVGYSQQQFTGFARLTVIEHLNLYNSLLPSKPSAFRESLFQGESLSFKTEVKELLTRLDLWHLRKEQVHTLSPSVLCRLQLALTVLGSPPLLLLDEPTSSCNAESRVLIRKEVLHYRHTNKDAAIVFVSNDISELESLGGHLWFIKDNTHRDVPSIAKLGPRTQHDCVRLSTSDPVAAKLITAHLGDARSYRSEPAATDDIEELSLRDQMMGIISTNKNITATMDTEIEAVIHREAYGCYCCPHNHRDHEQNVPAGSREAPLDFFIRPCYEDSLRSLLGMTPNIPVSRADKITERIRRSSSESRTRELKSNVVKGRIGIMEICMWMEQIWFVYGLRFTVTSTMRILGLIFQVIMPVIVIFAISFSSRSIVPPRLLLSSDSLLGGQISVTMSHCGRSIAHYNTRGDNIWRSNVRTEWLDEECGDSHRDRLGVMSVRSMKNQLAAIVLQDRDRDQWDRNGSGNGDDGDSEADFSVWVKVPDSEDMVTASSYLKDYLDTMVADICTSDSSISGLKGQSLWDFHTVSGNGSQYPSGWARDIVCALGIHVDIRNRTIVTPVTTTTTTSTTTTPYVVLETGLSVDSDILGVDEHGISPLLPTAAERIPPTTHELMATSLDYELYSWPLVATNTSDLDATSVYRGYSGTNAVLLYLLLLSVCALGAVPHLYASGTVIQIRLGGISSAIFWVGNWMYEMLALSGVYEM
eukprot:gene5171-10341_t